MVDRMKFPEVNKGVSNEHLRFVSEVWALEIIESGGIPKRNMGY